MKMLVLFANVNYKMYFRLWTLRTLMISFLGGIIAGVGDIIASVA